MTVQNLDPEELIAVSKPVFVLGCGRSGTTWLGELLNSHPEIEATVEKPEIFVLATTMAMLSHETTRRLPVLTRYYRQEIERVHPLRYADKSHPVIWFAELLARKFPQAQFVGIQRLPYPTIASMIRHDSVSNWTARWREFPIPNRFLGISVEMADKYADLSVAEKHALRWRTHAVRMCRLRKELGDRMHFLEYEQLHQNTSDELRRLAEFLDLNDDFPPPNVRKDSIDRWRNDLTDNDVERIRAITSIDPDLSWTQIDAGIRQMIEA